MAVFGIGKKKTSEKQSVDKAEKKNVAPTRPVSENAEPKKGGRQDIREVLLRPRITEKATILTGENVYTFEILPDANKREVVEAVQRIYKVTPRKVTIAKQPRRSVFSRTTGTRGMKKGIKKAMVFLKEGDTIQFI